MSRRAEFLMLVAAASAMATGLFVWSTAWDPASDICAYWTGGPMAAAIIGGGIVVVLGLASLGWRVLRGVALAVLVGVVVGLSIGTVLLAREIDQIRSDGGCES